MEIDVAGKVNEKKLSTAKALLPLFEAVVNSIHAIEDSENSAKGKIIIKVVRNQQKELAFEKSGKLPPIQDLIIGDNGVGFNHINFNSFNRAHSTYKKSRGGKGIGRFIWLRAFDHVEVSSVFAENGQKHKRVFRFEKTAKGIEQVNDPVLVEPNQSTKTVVALKNLHQDFWQWCNYQVEEIAQRIIEHCFVYFLRNDCPTIVIEDDDTAPMIVNDLVDQFTHNMVEKFSFALKDYTFDAQVVHFYGTKQKHKIHYCAHQREVVNKALNTQLPELETQLVDKKGDEYSLAVYVTSEFLDEKVDEARTNIQFAPASDADGIFPDELSEEEISEVVAAKIREMYSAQIKETTKRKLEVVSEFIQHNPKYRFLLKYKKDRLGVLQEKVLGNKEKLAIELFKIQNELDAEVEKEVQLALAAIEGKDGQWFKKSHTEMYRKLVEVGSTKLNDFTTHRTLVLALLEKQLTHEAAGAAQQEKAILQLIFPAEKAKGGSVEEHNLWLIDERLANPWNLANAEGASTGVPFALADHGQPQQSVIIIAFNTQKNDQNPVDQVLAYAQELNAGNIKDMAERPIRVRQDAPNYGYVVGTITEALQQQLEAQGFLALPEGGGYALHNAAHNLHIAVMGFGKLLKDAQQRTETLLNKLSKSVVY